MEQLSRAGMEILGTHWNMKVFWRRVAVALGPVPLLGCRCPRRAQQEQPKVYELRSYHWMDPFDTNICMSHLSLFCSLILNSTFLLVL